MGSNPFAVSDVEVVDLVDSLLLDVDIERQLYSVHLAESLDDAALLGLSVTSRVFRDSFGNSDTLLMDEYAQYLPSMLHVIVCDVRGRRPVGSIGLLRLPARELKTVVDIESGPWGAPAEQTLATIGATFTDRDVWDIGTFAVAAEARRSRVAVALLHAGYLASVNASVHAWTAILDNAVLKGVDALSHGTFKPIPGLGSRPYLGSNGSTPIFAEVPYDHDVMRGRLWANGQSLLRNYAFDGRLSGLRRDLVESVLNEPVSVG